MTDDMVQRFGCKADSYLPGQEMAVFWGTQRVTTVFSKAHHRNKSWNDTVHYIVVTVGNKFQVIWNIFTLLYFNGQCEMFRGVGRG